MTQDKVGTILDILAGELEKLFSPFWLIHRIGINGIFDIDYPWEKIGKAQGGGPDFIGDGSFPGFPA